jgi:hypothetical protein
MPGTTKARASGIDDAGTDTSDLYANIIYGSAAPATGIGSKSADINTLYAAKGTAQYKLPIDGNSYSATGRSSGIAPIKPASGIIYVQVGNGQYNVQTQVVNNGGAAVVNNYTFSIPAGMNYFYIAFGQTHQSGNGAISNTAAGWTSITSTLSTYLTASASQSGNTGTSEMQGNVTLYFGATQSAVMNGTFTVDAVADISA